MKRYTMFVDWKNQYCQKLYYPRQSTNSVQSPSNYYGIFHRTRTTTTKNLKICIETQKSPYSQAHSSVLSRVWLFVTPWSGAGQASLSVMNSWSLLKLMSIESVLPSNHIILCRPLLLLPSIFPSIRVFSNELVLPSRWAKYWSFSFSISPSNEYSGLISFRMNWLDLLAVQGSLKSLL